MKETNAPFTYFFQGRPATNGIMIAAHIVIIAFLQEAVSLVHVEPNMKTFSYAIKNGFLHPKEEKTLYKHNTGQPGVITEQWFTGLECRNRSMRMRIYIDDEKKASLDFQAFTAHATGFRETDDLSNVPWGTKWFGHSAKGGGMYNTFRIPFGKSFRVTATNPCRRQFWYIVRGVENYPVVLGDLVLPPTARLKLYKRENVSLSAFDFLKMAHVNSSAGAVFLVTMAATGSDLTFLEGCFRAFIDGSNEAMWLSSGTEDFFLSAYYFDAGTYQNSNAGLTYINASTGYVSAYKFFENDPLLFSKSLELWWRCSDIDFTKDKYGCPHTWPDPSPSASPDRKEYYKREKLSKKEKIAIKNIKREIQKKKKKKDSATTKRSTHTFRDEKPYVYATLRSLNVTTYTWVYEW